MKTSIIFLVIFTVTLQVYSQKSEVFKGRDKKTESKIGYIKYKYNSGEYEEASLASKNFSNSVHKKSRLWHVNTVQAKIYLALSSNASLRFDQGADAYKEAAVIAEKDTVSESRFLSYLAIADYLQESEEMTEALKFLDKASAMSEADKSLNYKYNLNFIKSKVLLKQRFLNEALKLIEEQTAYRLEMASASEVADENKTAVVKKTDFQNRKENYASLINLKSSCLIAKGAYTESKSVLENNKSWIASNLGRDHILYRESLEKLGEVAMLENEYAEASSLYTDAYLSTTFPEYEQNKINHLTRTIIATIYADQTVKYKNYLRRLEMYAFRTVGTVEPFQLAFEYAEAYKSFIEGDYSAANYRLDRLAEAFKILPPAHRWNRNILHLKSAISLKSGDVKGYKESLSKLSTILKESYGDCPTLHKTQLALALYEIDYGKDFIGAEKILRTSYYSVLGKEIIKESTDNIRYLTAFAALFAKTDRYDSAVSKMAQAVEIAKTVYKENSPEYLLELCKHSEYLILSGKYKEGFDNLQKATELSGSVKGGEPENLQRAYMIMAKLYALKGEFDKSQALLNKAYKLTLSGYEKQALAEAETNEQLASLYLQTGNYFRAEKALLRSLEVKESKLEESSPLIIHTYQELARLHLLNGNYTHAEQNVSKATKITELVFGKKSLRYAECLLIYSEYYLAIGDLKKAQEYCTQADEIELTRWGKENLRRAEILSRLALIRSKMPEYKSTEIEKLYQEAATIIKKSIGVDNPLYANLIQKQAEFYIETSKPEKAEQLLTEAEKFWIAKLGSENRYVAEIELLRGNISYTKSKYDQAEKNYQKARNLYSSIFDNNHPWYIQASGKLARVHYMRKHPEKSMEIMEEIIPKYSDYIVKYFPSLSFNEKKKFWNNIKEEFEFYNFIALCIYNKEKPKLSASVYNNIISTKALLLSSNIKLRERILNSKDSVLVELFNDWVAQKEYLTNILSLTKQQLTEQNIDVKFIEGHIEQLEREMSKRSQVFSGEEKKQNLTWKEIKDELSENEYAVEIVNIRHFNKYFTDSTVYAALLIDKNTHDYPQTVLLADGKKMDGKHLKYFRNATTMKMKDESSYKVYWKPISEKIAEGATVYLSSDGVYNQLNVEMMLMPDGNYVLDKYTIVPLTNTKDLLHIAESEMVVAEKSKEKKKSGKDVKKENVQNYILCGNPDFYTGTVKVREKSVESLPGAEKEVIDINKFLVSLGLNTTQFLNDDVTEDTLRFLRNPKVLHIATHGFFKDEKSNSEEESALLNSGLILYGGGDIINHPENNYVNHKSGILTAAEAMTLVFDETELVVLSACETGLGAVSAGEGVYGLQRSFLIAGADAVIMSLFKVSDEVTQKLMLSFYKKWLATGDKRKSFIEAKKEIKQEYNSPLFWGAFVMIEGKPQRIKEKRP